MERSGRFAKARTSIPPLPEATAISGCPQPPVLGGAALKVQVVDGRGFSSAIQFVHQRNSSALPPLKNREGRVQQRLRLPEAGLMRQSQNARGTNREAGED